MADGIPCPRCRAAQSSVIDTRKDGTAIQRQRRCKACRHAFTTTESVDGGAATIAALRAESLQLRLRVRALEGSLRRVAAAIDGFMEDGDGN